MASCIPDFHRKSQSLSEIVEDPHKQIGKRRKTARKNIALHKLSWGEIHEFSFLSLKESLQSDIELTFLRESHIISVFTDVSE